MRLPERKKTMRKKNADSALDKIGADLAAAREKRDLYSAKVKELEKKYSELEAAQISEIVRKAGIGPKQLAEILASAGLDIEGQGVQDNIVEREKSNDEEV